MLASDPAKFIGILEESVSNEYRLTQWSLAVASSVIPVDDQTRTKAWYKSLDAAVEELRQMGTAWATSAGPTAFSSISETAATYGSVLTQVVGAATEAAARNDDLAAAVLRELLPTLADRAATACDKVQSALGSSDEMLAKAKSIKLRIAAALADARAEKGKASAAITALQAELKAAEIERVAAETLMEEREVSIANFVKLIWPATGAPVAGAAGGWWTGRIMFQAGEITAAVKGEMWRRGAQSGAAVGIGLAAIGLIYITYNIRDARSKISNAVAKALKKIEDLSIEEQRLFILELMIESMNGLITTYEELPVTGKDLLALWEAERDRLFHAVTYLQDPGARVSHYPDLSDAALHAASAAWTRISDAAIQLQKLRGVIGTEAAVEVQLQPKLAIAR